MPHYFIFLINSLVCCVKEQKSLSGLLLVFAGSFAGFTALFLISLDFLGLVLLLEGLLLLGLGVKEGDQSLRMEVYVLLALGLILNINGLSDTVVSVDYDLYRFEQYGFILLTLLLSTAAVLIVSVMIGKLFSEAVPSDFEFKVRIITKELLSYSSAASCLFISNLLIADNTTHLLPLLSLLLLYLAARDKLKLTELLAWLIILLPLIFLPKVLRDFESYFSLALWGSCFISLLSARLLSNRML
ncbi:hypothetical protein CXF72_11375 [Psychromonas sp. MB-3u-54]|uniref:hypothetical protein n=1 Tax=Psychromonas sp. MB-3u-54 TaxID=2058319 RepID=UPI000C328251|nr:hypothetical protein [Psychromonas sp. MB-3u-54]PKH02486.1 hypothetical protein CXF72_11375 [Psychromonas sp. MB-3u-54]